MPQSFLAGVGYPPIRHGVYPLDPTWDEFRRSILLAMPFTEGVGPAYPVGNAAVEIGPPAASTLEPEWGNTLDLGSDGSQREGHPGKSFRNTAAASGPYFGYRWNEFAVPAQRFFEIGTTRDWAIGLVIYQWLFTFSNQSKVLVAKDGNVPWSLIYSPINGGQFFFNQGFFQTALGPGGFSFRTRYVLVLNARSPDGGGRPEQFHFWVNGDQIFSVGNVTAPWFTPGPLRLAAGSKPNNSFGGYMEQFVVMRRSLTDGEVRAYSEDPFGWLRADPRFLQPAATPSLDHCIVASTGVVPRVAAFDEARGIVLAKDATFPRINAVDEAKAIVAAKTATKPRVLADTGICEEDG